MNKPADALKSIHCTLYALRGSPPAAAAHLHGRIGVSAIYSLGCPDILRIRRLKDAGPLQSRAMIIVSVMVVVFVVVVVVVFCR